MKEINKIKKELLEAQAYCQQVNGRSSCKNCGLDFGKLIDLLEAQSKEHNKEIARKLDKYFDGLIVIPNPELTLAKLKEYLSSEK